MIATEGFFKFPSQLIGKPSNPWPKSLKHGPDIVLKSFWGFVKEVMYASESFPLELASGVMTVSYTHLTLPTKRIV